MYQLFRTDTADEGIRKIVLFIAENFSNEVALEKLDELEAEINKLADNPHIGVDPKYTLLRRQGYKVLITEKDLVFYKIFEKEKVVIIYAVTDQRQDYIKILEGI